MLRGWGPVSPPLEEHPWQHGASGWAGPLQMEPGLSQPRSVGLCGSFTVRTVCTVGLEGLLPPSPISV